MRHSQPIRFVLVMILFLIGSLEQAIAKKQISLATAEREPYIGKSLPSQGYVHELVTEVFKRSGYEVAIAFYPLERANQMAKKGKVDGLIPSYYEKSLEEDFIFSDPFPGDNIGLLKKKSLQVSYSVDPRNNLKESLRGLEQYDFGVVRGASIAPAFDQAKFLNKQFATTDLQNIDKLEAGRMNFAVIDKYSAADLMVSQRPHLIGRLEFMRPPLVSNAFHVAFSKKSKGYQQRHKEFNRGLQTLIQEGILDKILTKHGILQQKTAKPGKVKLTIGTVNNGNMIVMQGLSKQFEKDHPEIELEWRVLEENTLRQRLLSDLAISDGHFDIMTIGTYEAPIWAKRGWIAPLQTFIEDYDLEDVLATVRGGLSYQGQLYALPFYAESNMMFYRKDLFQKAGLTMPSQPTFQDVKKFAKAIHNPANQIYGICLRGKAGWGENMAIVSTMVNTFGGRWFDEKWHPVIDSPEWKKAVSFYRELITQYGHPQTSLNGFNENLSLFSNGHCGIWIDATVAAGMLFNPKQSKVHDQLGFAPAPIAVTPKGSHWLWSWALAIPDSSKNKKEALQFINWATSKEYIQQVAQQDGWVSVPPGTRKSTYTNKNYQNAAPFADFVLKAIQAADPKDSTLKPKPYSGIQFVGIPEFPAIGHQVGLNMVKVIEGKMSVDQALQDSQKLVYSQMRKSGYY